MVYRPTGSAHACTSPPQLLIDPLSVFFIADVTALAEIQYFGAQASAMWRLKAAATARQVAAAASGAAALLRSTNGRLGAAHWCLLAPLDWREQAGHCPFLALFVHAHTQVREVASRTTIKRFVARMPGAASWCGKLLLVISECHSHPFVPPSPTPNPVGVASFRTTTSMRKRLDSPHTPHGRITADPVPLGTVLDSGGGGDWRASTFSLERLSWLSESIKYITTITGGSLH